MPLAIRPGCDDRKVLSLCEKLIQQRRGTTLGREIKAALPSGSIPDATVFRLGRWCFPARAEPLGMPLARQLSGELFGRLVSRGTT